MINQLVGGVIKCVEFDTYVITKKGTNNNPSSNYIHALYSNN